MFGYVKAHWRGELPLLISYWVNTILFGLLLTLGASFWTEAKVFQENISLSWLNLIFTFAYYVWSLIGLWRCAHRTIKEAKEEVPSGVTFWGYVVKVLVIVGVARLILAYVPATSDLIAITIFNQTEINSEHSVDLLGDSGVVLVGYINKRSVDELVDAFEDPQRTALIIASSGGILSEVFRLADLVQNRSLIVIAQHECGSGCLLVLTASPQSVTTPDTIITFHNPEAAAEFKLEAIASEFKRQRFEYYGRFVQYGVPFIFIEEMKKQPETILTFDNLKRTGIVDYIWLSDTEEYLTIEDYCAANNC